MALSNSHPHPTGQANPATARALAILLPAGAWDAAPEEIPCSGFWWVRLYFVYQRGAEDNDGAIDYYYDTSPYSADVAGVEDWYHGTLYAAARLAQCVLNRSMVQQEIISYCAEGNNAETFHSPPIHLAGCVERLRVFCREIGDAGNPGTASVIACFYREG